MYLYYSQNGEGVLKQVPFGVSEKHTGVGTAVDRVPTQFGLSKGMDLVGAPNCKAHTEEASGLA